MKLADLSPETLEALKALRYDRIVEKHEGPWQWKTWLEHDPADFIEFEGYDVLLPVEQDRHPNITPLRVIPSADGQTLTIFLRDTTHYFDDFFTGYLAICEKWPNQNFFVAMVYHEWFFTEYGFPSRG